MMLNILLQFHSILTDEYLAYVRKSALPYIKDTMRPTLLRIPISSLMYLCVWYGGANG